jgi:aminoglycoside phosphotransferase family enzyme
MRFVEALEAGTTEFGVPDRVITTFVSKLFIFGDRVLKIYKHDTYFFADLLNFESRREFFTEDFFYNNTAAPEIYLHLWGVKKTGGVFSLVPPSLGVDFVIEMSKIDDTQTLTKLLLTKKLSENHVVAFIDSLVDTLKTLTRERREKMNDLYEKGLLDIMRENTKSLEDWMHTQESKVQREDTAMVYSTLSKALERELYFKNIHIDELSAAIDNNSDNLILLNGKPSFIDIMPPMVVWRVVDEYATVARLIVDIEVLGTKELGDCARAAYAKYRRKIPLVVTLMHEIRAAAIQWPYRYMLGQDDIAERFASYTRKKETELRALL